MSEKVINNLENRKEIIEMIKTVSNYLNDIRDNLCAPYGLSSIQAVIILDIYHNPDHTKVTDICKRLNKSTNTISPLVNRLVSKGYLYKEVSQQDQRVVYVKLTEKTQKITQSIAVDVNDYTWPIFESLTEDEFDQVFNSLGIIVRVISK